MYDRKKAAALARQVGADFGAALTVALAYVGDRLGIFRTLASGTALTTAEIAAQTGLNERYVREWAATRRPRDISTTAQTSLFCLGRNRWQTAVGLEAMARHGTIPIDDSIYFTAQQLRDDTPDRFRKES
mgnify:CR=1 FL=1